MRQRHLRTVGGLVIAGMILTACGGDNGNTEAAATGDNQEASASGGTLRVAADIDPDGLDPHLGSNATSMVWVGAMFDTLVGRDRDGAPAPGLAESWEVSDDGLTYTFELREGVEFHNGRALEADDVVFNLDRLRDPDNGATNAGNLAAIEEVRAEDEDTVIVQLSTPNAALPSELAFGARVAIVAPESFEDGAMGDPIGTGPLTFEEYRRDDVLRFGVNEDYWDGPAAIEAVEVRIIGDGMARLTAAAEGEVDFAVEVPASQAEAFAESDQIQLQEALEDNANWLGINTTREPFDDPDLRAAMMAAVDRDDIVQAGWDGFAECTDQPFFASSPWHLDVDNAPDCDGDVDQAASMLSDAGYEEGEVSVEIVSLDFAGTRQEAEVVASAWSEMGIPTSVQEVDIATFLERGGTGEYDVAYGVMGSVNDPNRPYAYFDPASALHPFTGPLDLSDLVAQGRSATDEGEREEVYRELLSEIHANDSFAYTVNTLRFNALSQRVQGYDQAAVLSAVWQGDGDLTDLTLAQ